MIVTQANYNIGFGYVSPKGLRGEPCGCWTTGAERVGPTCDRIDMFSAATCDRCSRIMRSRQDLSWQQYVWARRWNDRAVRLVREGFRD